MDNLKRSINILKELLCNPKITSQEDKEICGELYILEQEYKLLENILKETRLGISQYGGYFNK
jgi:hypothetical protein